MFVQAQWPKYAIIRDGSREVSSMAIFPSAFLAISRKNTLMAASNYTFSNTLTADKFKKKDKMHMV